MKRFILLISDLAMLTGALWITLSLRYQPRVFDYQLGLHAKPFAVIFLFWILAFYITNLYEGRSLRNTLEFYSNLLRAGVFATLLSIAFFYLTPSLVITPRANLALFSLIFAGLIIISRFLLNRVFARQSKKSIVVTGITPQSRELAEYIKTNPQLGYAVASMIDIQNTDDIRMLKSLITQGTVDMVVISPEAYHMPNLIDLFYKSLEHRVAFQNLASFYEAVTGRVPLGAIDQVWFLENLTENSKRAYEIAKRISDIILAFFLGIPFLLVYPFLALAIKISSPGSVFYRQRRMGQNGHTFEIIKLRSMRLDAEANTGAVWARDNDPRVTPLGRFLRTSRIDEFPQLWNILKGEMSFVGPRAERPEFHERLKTGVPFYEERYLIKPGLSGWAQINYPYGASVADAAQKLQYDLYYIKHRSLILDLGIILRTINISVRHAGR